MLFPDLFFNASSSPSATDVLQTTRELLCHFFGQVTNVSSSEVTVEFSSRHLLSGFTFDALTIEIPLAPSHLKRQLMYHDDFFVTQASVNKSSISTATGGSGDWYYDIDSGSDCSNSGYVVNESEYDADDNPITIEVQVQVQARRWDSTAHKEPPHVALRMTNGSYSDSVRMDCPDISRASLRAVSVGKRIEGDATGIGSVVYGTNKIVRLKNVCKVYSFTVGDLSWQTQDLAKAYGAECVGTDATGSATTSAAVTLVVAPASTCSSEVVTSRYI